MPKPLSQCAPGTSGLNIKPRRQVLDEMASHDLDITTSSEFFAGMQLTYALPATQHKLGWWKCKNQGNIGQCFGFAGAQSGEAEHWRATGEQIEFSGTALYRMVQEAMGSVGRDTGSDPTLGSKVAMREGLIPTSLYADVTDGYHNIQPIPEQAREAAQQYRIAKIVLAESVADIRKALQTQGCHVQVNSRWTAAFDQPGDRVERFAGSWDPNAQHAGHAYQFVDTLQGSDEIVLANSWNTGWGNEGMKIMSNQAVAELFEDDMTLVYFWSLSEQGKQRKIDIVADDWL